MTIDPAVPTTIDPVAPITIDPVALTLPDSPFRGIEPFRYVDRQIFFSREDETQKLFRSITIYRGVLLYGESGTGKSSLINAGLIPAAIEAGFAPERVRVQPRKNEEIVVERISMHGDKRAPFLPSIFADGEGPARIVFSIGAFKERLRKSTSPHPLFIFDQFEEFVTLFEEAPRGTALAEALEVQQTILNSVVDLLRNPPVPVKLLFAFREDYLAKLNKLFVLCPDLRDQYVRITTLEIGALRTIIRGPFERFPGHFEREFSENLCRMISEDVQKRSEGGILNLTEVQIACLKLWQPDTPATLFEQDGVEGLLEDFLSDAIAELAKDGLDGPAVALLTHMITSSGARNVISEDNLIESLSEETNVFEKPKLRDALIALERKTKLVRREQRRNVFYYEIASEFLVPWISRQKAERLAQIEQREFKSLVYKVVGALVLIGLLGAGAAWREINTSQSAAYEKAKVSEEVEQANALVKLADSDKNAAEVKLREVSQEKDEALKKKEDELLKQKEALEKDKTAALSRADAAEGELTGLRALLSNASEGRNREYRDLYNQYGLVIAQKSRLEAEKATALQQAEAAKKDADEARRALSVASSEANRYKFEALRLRTQLATQRPRAAKINDVLSNLESELEAATTARNRLADNIRNPENLRVFKHPMDLTNELSDFARGIDKLKKDINELRKALTPRD